MIAKILAISLLPIGAGLALCFSAAPHEQTPKEKAEQEYREKWHRDEIAQKEREAAQLRVQAEAETAQANEDAETNRQVGRFIHDHFNDPDSVKDLTVNRPYRLKNGHMNYVFYCRAKNGFGAYTGLHVYEFEMAR